MPRHSRRSASKPTAQTPNQSEKRSEKLLVESTPTGAETHPLLRDAFVSLAPRVTWLFGPWSKVYRPIASRAEPAAETDT